PDPVHRHRRVRRGQGRPAARARVTGAEERSGRPGGRRGRGALSGIPSPGSPRRSVRVRPLSVGSHHCQLFVRSTRSLSGGCTQVKAKLFAALALMGVLVIGFASGAGAVPTLELTTTTTGSTGGACASGNQTWTVNLDVTIHNTSVTET